MPACSGHPFKKYYFNVQLTLNKKEKSTIKPRLFLQAVVFDLFSAHQTHFQFFLKRQSVGSSLMLKEVSFQALRAGYENAFLAYSRLYLLDYTRLY